MNGERGSAKLIRERMGTSRVIGEKDLEVIARIAGLEDVVLARWWWLGQPAPDVIAGSFDLKLDRVGEVIGELLRTEVPLELRVFPKGIPWPEEVVLSFHSGMR